MTLLHARTLPRFTLSKRKIKIQYNRPTHCITASIKPTYYAFKDQDDTRHLTGFIEFILFSDQL